MTKVVCLVVSVIVMILLAGVSTAVADSGHYLNMARLKLNGYALSCTDVNWAAGQGLIEPVEVRYLAELGVRCPDESVARSEVTEQSVVMLAMAVKRQLTCADIQWNAGKGWLTWVSVINLLGYVANCQVGQYERMVALQAGGQLSCDDINWNRNQGNITEMQAGWLRRGMGYIEESGVDWARAWLRCLPPKGGI
jgi:hypothetical protein